MTNSYVFKGDSTIKLDSEKNRIIIASEFRKGITEKRVLVRRERMQDYTPLLELIFSVDHVEPGMSIEERLNKYSFGEFLNIGKGYRISLSKRNLEHLSKGERLEYVTQCGGGDRIYVFNAEDFKRLEESKKRQA